MNINNYNINFSICPIVKKYIPTSFRVRAGEKRIEQLREIVYLSLLEKEIVGGNEKFTYE